MFRFYLLLSRLVKPFAAETEHAVGARAVVLPGDGCAELDQLRRGEAPLQPLSQFRGHARGGRRNSISQLQHQLLIRIEQIALRVPVQVADLIVRDADPSASGRVDVDSKRAFNQLGGANLAQSLELRRDQIGFVESLIESRVGNEIVGMQGCVCQRSNVPAEALAGYPADDRNLEF